MLICGLQVNKRLEDQEAESGDADPDYPKVQWPPEGLCALCHLPTLAPELGVSWNVEEVYRFLLRFYGGEPPSAASVRDEHLQLVATTAAGGRWVCVTMCGPVICGSVSGPQSQEGCGLVLTCA